MPSLAALGVSAVSNPVIKWHKSISEDIRKDDKGQRNQKNLHLRAGFDRGVFLADYIWDVKLACQEDTAS
jgi:hypothetical protein